MHGSCSPRQQTLLRIDTSASERTLYPSRFRELLARQPESPPELFHRDATGRTGTGAPAIRTVGAKTWVGLLADGGHEGVLYKVMGSALRAASQECGSLLPLKVEQHELSLQRRDEPVGYFLREAAIKRRTDIARASDIETLVENRVYNAIESTCERFGMDCPTKDELGIIVSEVEHQGLRLQTTTGVTDEYVALVNARVLIHAELKGFWFVGNLTSRGYGRLMPDKAIGYALRTPMATGEGFLR